MTVQQQFGIEIECDESQREPGKSLFTGTVEVRSGARLFYLWHLLCLDIATADCIEGTRIAELIVDDDRDGVTVMQFQGGSWMVKPKGNWATVIRQKLINYADE